jgi:hypothetical protein
MHAVRFGVVAAVVQTNTDELGEPSSRAAGFDKAESRRLNEEKRFY